MKPCDDCDRSPCICKSGAGVKLMQQFEAVALKARTSRSETGYAGAMIVASMVGQTATTEEALNQGLEMTFRTIREAATEIFKNPDKTLGPKA